jgi:anti-anti-sigma factor
MTDRQTRMTSLYVLPLPDRVGLAVAGEIDITVRPKWAAALSPLVDRDSDVDLELGRLAFVDVGGVGVLVSAAQRLTRHRRMILHQPPSMMIRTLDVLYPRITAIEVNSR